MDTDEHGGQKADGGGPFNRAPTGSENRKIERCKMSGQQTGLRWFDWLLGAVIFALLAIVAWCVLSSPPLWAWCLDVLDARNWRHWTWTALVVALLAMLAAIRLRPERGRRSHG